MNLQTKLSPSLDFDAMSLSTQLESDPVMEVEESLADLDDNELVHCVSLCQFYSFRRGNISFPQMQEIKKLDFGMKSINNIYK